MGADHRGFICAHLRDPRFSPRSRTEGSGTDLSRRNSVAWTGGIRVESTSASALPDGNSKWPTSTISPSGPDGAAVTNFEARMTRIGKGTANRRSWTRIGGRNRGWRGFMDGGKSGLTAKPAHRDTFARTAQLWKPTDRRDLRKLGHAFPAPRGTRSLAMRYGAAPGNWIPSFLGMPFDPCDKLRAGSARGLHEAGRNVHVPLLQSHAT